LRVQGYLRWPKGRNGTTIKLTCDNLLIRIGYQ
jgi:hypothetical protein